MLTLRNVHWKAGATHVIKWIDMDVKTWQAIGIVGPNWCGKSSLLNTINGFNTVNDGKIVFCDTDITTASVEKRADMWIWRVFQSFGIFKSLTLFENLSLAYVKQLWWKQKLLPLSFLPQRIKDEIDAVLQDLDLYDKKHERAGNLSVGQMRLLEIARLYLQDTKLYLLDEPTAGVSPKLKGKVIELINEIVAQEKTVIIVEHDFNFLGLFVHDFYVLNDGEVALTGDYETIKNSTVVQELYFGD